VRAGVLDWRSGCPRSNPQPAGSSRATRQDLWTLRNGRNARPQSQAGTSGMGRSSRELLKWRVAVPPRQCLGGIVQEACQTTSRPVHRAPRRSPGKPGAAAHAHPGQHHHCRITGQQLGNIERLNPGHVAHAGLVPVPRAATAWPQRGVTQPPQSRGGGRRPDGPATALYESSLRVPSMTSANWFCRVGFSRRSCSPPSPGSPSRASVRPATRRGRRWSCGPRARRPTRRRRHGPTRSRRARS
jgi:hypothetical protein